MAADEQNDASAREFVKSSALDEFKSWIDFRQFLNQRRLLLNDPESALKDHSADSKWKGPWQFALQGLVAVSLLISTMNGGLAFFQRTNDPDEAAEAKAELARLKESLEVVEQEDDNSPLFDLAGISKKDSIAAKRAGILELEERIPILPFMKKLEDFLQKLTLPISLVLAAYSFRFFSKLGMGKHYPAIEHIHIAYLYFVTAGFFWLNLVDSVVLSLLARGQIALESYIYWYGVLLLCSIWVVGLTAQKFRDAGYPGMSFARLETYVGSANLVMLFVVVITMQAILYCAERVLIWASKLT